MTDLEGVIADYLQACRELASLASGDGCWKADSIVFDILEIREREILVAVRFIEIMQDVPGTTVEQIDRYGRLRLELDEFGEILSADVY